MSSDLFPTVKSKKHAIVSVDKETMDELRQDMRREDRGFSYMVSRIVEEHYGEKSKLKTN
jgi:hypothetical protein